MPTRIQEDPFSEVRSDGPVEQYFISDCGASDDGDCDEAKEKAIEIVNMKVDIDGALTQYEAKNGLQHKAALAPLGIRRWLVDNSTLKAPTVGIAVRGSPSMEDRINKQVDWQTELVGVAVDEHWLRIGEGQFLPRRIQGHLVVVALEEAAECRAAEEAARRAAAEAERFAAAEDAARRAEEEIARRARDKGALRRAGRRRARGRARRGSDRLVEELLYKCTGMHAPSQLRTGRVSMLKVVGGHHYKTPRCAAAVLAQFQCHKWEIHCHGRVQVALSACWYSTGYRISA